MSTEFKNIKEVLEYILNGGVVTRADRPGKIYKLNDHNNVSSLKTALGSPFSYKKHIEKKNKVILYKFVYLRSGKWRETKAYYKNSDDFSRDFPTVTYFKIAEHTKIEVEE